MSNYSSIATIVLGTALTISGCKYRDSRAEQMNKEQPIFKIDHSVERDNINRRLALANDPTQIMWIYCLSDIGNVVLSSPAVGKPSSSNKRLEPEVTISYSETTSASKSYLEMGADGTYGSSDSYVYWFTPEGQYFQWNGAYIASNAPLKLEKPIFNVRDIDYQEMERGKKAQEALKAGRKINNSLEVRVEGE